MQENKRPGQKNVGLQQMDKRKPGPTGPVVENVKQEGGGESKQNEWYLCEECVSQLLSLKIDHQKVTGQN